MGRADYLKLFRDTLGDEVRKFAPQTHYVTGSPDCGDVHTWGVWHGNNRQPLGMPFAQYRSVHGFASEFGFQAFPRAEDRGRLHRPRGSRFGLFAGDEAPRAVEPGLPPPARGRHQGYRQAHASGGLLFPRAQGLRQHLVAGADHAGLRHQVRGRRLAAGDAQVHRLRLLAVQRHLARHVLVVDRLFRPLEGPAVHGQEVLRPGAGLRQRRHRRRAPSTCM